MRLLRKLLLFLVGLIAIVAVIGFTLPDSRHLERTVVINSPPAIVFTVLNSYKLFNKWSPWAEIDPKTAYEVTGPASGVGAREAWMSDDPRVSSGSQEIVESVPYTTIKQKLVFKDFSSVNTATFTLAPEGTGTKVTWSYDSTFNGNLMYRYFGLLLDKMIGPDYDRGIARMKTFIESLPKADFSALKVEVVDVQPVTIAFAPVTSAFDPKAIGDALGAAYVGKIGPFLKANTLNQAAAPVAIYDNCEPAGPACAFRAGIPVDRADVQVPDTSEVKIGQTYAGKALKISYTGPYAAMQPTYNMVSAYIAANGYERNGPPMEQYVSDPGKTPEAELVTLIVLPIK